MAQTATAFGLIWAGLVMATGMVANVGIGRVVELYGIRVRPGPHRVVRLAWDRHVAQ
jgi:hypothetical protein